MKKSLIVLALVLVAALGLTACTQPSTSATATPAPEATAAPAAETTAPEATEAAPAATEAAEKEFTAEELAKFNGKDGQPAYIAVDGVVYDVTNAAPWKGGGHNGYEAGKDLTEEIKTKSPHGVSKLTPLPVVGKLVTP